MARLLTVLTLTALAAPASGPAVAAPSPGAPPAAVAAASQGQVFLTVAEALALAYPECEIDKRTVYLTDAQRDSIEERLGAELSSGIARPYVALRQVEGSEQPEVVGYAWFDTHRVRTHKESVMFAVDPTGAIRRVELLAFGEPPDYVPSPRWYAQFLGQRFGEQLRVGRAIRPITGASLTVHATTDAARRVLAIQEQLFPAPAPEPTPEPEAGAGAAAPAQRTR
jgi:hypothetical protein